MSGAARHLSLRLPHEAGEPAHGLLLRVSGRYGTPPARLAARWGFTLGELVRGVGVERFAGIVRADAGLLAAWSPVVRTRKRRVELRGERLMLGDWSMSTRRWCPACLAQDELRGEHAPFHRAWWDVRSVGLCPDHLVPLRDRCPRCSEPTGWRTPRLARCRCGCALSSAPVAPVVAEDARMALHIGVRLGAPVIDASAAPAMPLDVLPSFATRLGASLRCAWSERRPGRSGIDLESDMSAALAQLRDPVAEFGRALDRLSAGMARRATGLGGAYGWVYTRWLAFPDQDRTGGALISAMRSHAVANGVIAADEPVLGHARTDGVNLSAAADRLGVGYERARRIVLPTTAAATPVRRGVAAVVPVEVVRELEERRAGGVDGRAAAALLGCSRRVVHDLRERGLLRVFDGAYDRREVAGLAARLAGGRQGDGGLVSIVRMARGAGLPLADLCKAALAGRVRSAALIPDPLLLADVGVIAADVPNPRRAPPLSVRGIAARLRVHEDVVRQLVPLGLLSDTASAEPTSGGVALFGRDFVTPAEIARRSGMYTRSVRALVEGAGVERALGPPISRQIFYRRLDVERVVPLFATFGPLAGDLTAAALH